MDISNLKRYACFGDGHMCSLNLRHDKLDEIQTYFKFEDVVELLKQAKQQLEVDSLMKPAEPNVCVHGEKLDGLCNACSDQAQGHRLIRIATEAVPALKPIPFTFDGGCGIVMPMRKMTD